MCQQIDFVWGCGHRSFAKFDNCINFGRTCYGASGNHVDRAVPGDCRECEIRKMDPNPTARLNDPYRKRLQRGGKR